MCGRLLVSFGRRDLKPIADTRLSEPVRNGLIDFKRRALVSGRQLVVGVRMLDRLERFPSST